VSKVLSKRLVKDKKSVPQPVTGVALIDTGATFSAIDQGVAERLGLNPIGVAKTGTASGRRDAPVYAVKFSIHGAMIIVEDGHVLGVDLEGTGMVALLGRSFLQNTLFIYDGIGSEFTIAL
ncbi:MAG: retroviral-like aspartic protease family protein, partial [Thermoplasmata archaeon]|nr:retroviral-like aspartic protease family protein [Thermoplasmata archaeon]